ncbi:ABC transporter substrate-binding protein [Devosia sp.]|uniref:ABC transporter substrate-binding protein n=1 Tax=Devosia sp. TaxID=1871048 RepID=UPI003A8D7E4D
MVSALALSLTAVALPGVALADPSGVLVIAENETPENLDPANATNSTVNQLLIGVYDALVQFKAGETSVSPRLATEWEVSDDGLSYTFTLRDDVTFHDGSPMTAEDVKFTLDRLQAASANVLNDLGPYVGAEVVDDNTIKLNLSASFGPFTSALSRVYIVSKAMVEPNMGDDNGRQWLAVNEAGTGPYTITAYNPTEAVTLKAYPEFWGGWDGEHVEEVVFRYVSEPSTQLSLLKSGEVQIAPDITVEDKLALMDEAGYTVDVGAAATPLYFAIKTAGDGPTADPEFREMLSMAFDRELHLEQVLMGFGTLPDGPLPVGWMGHVSGTETGYDLEAAKAMVDEKGWAGTKLLVRYLPAIQEEKSAVEQLQSNLAQIGIDLEAEGMTWPAQAATLTAIDTTSDLNMIYSFPGFPDPHAVLNSTFNGALTGVNGGYNWSQYENPDVDALLNDAATSPNPDERAEMYGEVQELVGDDHVVITVSLPGSVVAMSDAVKGYVYNPAHHQTFNYMDISVD